MKPWLSLGGRLSPAIKANLTAIGVDYALETSPQNESAYLIRPGKAHPAAVADPLVNPSLKWSVPRAFASSSHIGVRYGLSLSLSLFQSVSVPVCLCPCLHLALALALTLALGP